MHYQYQCQKILVNINYGAFNNQDHDIATLASTGKYKNGKRTNKRATRSQ